MEKTSSDTYLKGENIISKTRKTNNQSLLNSYFKFDASSEDLNIFAELATYEDLTKEKNSDKFEYILPNFTISKLLNNNTNTLKFGTSNNFGKIHNAWVDKFHLQDIYPATFINENNIFQIYAGLMCKHYILSESTFHL